MCQKGGGGLPFWFNTSRQFRTGQVSCKLQEHVLNGFCGALLSFVLIFLSITVLKWHRTSVLWALGETIYVFENTTQLRCERQPQKRTFTPNNGGERSKNQKEIKSRKFLIQPPSKPQKWNSNNWKSSVYNLSVLTCWKRQVLQVTFWSNWSFSG